MNNPQPKYFRSFKELREREGFIRCCGCKHIKHKDTCWRCEDCKDYSCDDCRLIKNGFAGCTCEYCEKARLDLAYQAKFDTQEYLKN